MHILFVFLFLKSRPGSFQPIFGILIANKSFRFAKAALVLLTLAGRMAAIFDVAMLCAEKVAQCKTRESP